MEELLYVSFMDKIKSYIPRNMVEKIYKKFEALPSTSSARVEEIETAVEKEIPQEILELVVRSAVRQISEYILKQKFQNIGVCGRGESQVLLLLKDNLQEEYEYKYAHPIPLVNMSYNHSNSNVRASVIQQMGFPNWIGIIQSNLQEREIDSIWESNFLLLLEEVDESIDLDTGRGALIFTTGSHEIPPTVKVDVEINMEDHLLVWKLFCAIVGEFVHSSTVQHLAIAIFEKCCGHVLAVVLMAKYLKNVTDVEIWEDALQELNPWSFQIQSMNRVIAKAMGLNWKLMDIPSKRCVKYFASHPKSTWFKKDSLISDWIKDSIILTNDQGKYILEDLTCTFLLENIGNEESVMMREEVYDIFVSKLENKMHQLVLNSEEPKDEEWDASDEEWDAREIHLMDSNLSELPESPYCPILLKLFLQRNYDLTEIPSPFFEHMPVLQVLDLSYTKIKKLPKSFFHLFALRKFFLRGCELFRYLPPEIGCLENLEELDLDKTKIMYLPEEIGKLKNLKVLKVSFYGYMSGHTVQLKPKIWQGAISNLCQLAELSIDVNPDDEQWDQTVEVIIEEVRRLKMLKSLNLYMPEATLLDRLIWGSTTAPSLWHFRYIVGHHTRGIIGRVPQEVEAEFNKWDKCLKFVNGKNLPNEIIKVLSYANAFFLDHHMTITKLSEFGNKNMEKLKFCIMSECNQLQTIVDDEYSDDVCSDDEYIDDSYLSLQYLNIYNMRNLVNICRGRPIRSSTLCCLKFLELHSCLKLSIVFTLDLIDNLNNLEELVIEDCPEVRYVLQSRASFHLSPRCLLPSLKRMALLYLPKLVEINNTNLYLERSIEQSLEGRSYLKLNGLNYDYIAPKLEGIGFYNCPKLRRLYSGDFSSKNLKVLKGETEWYDALWWGESGWKGRPEHLDDIFSPINWMEEDVLTQMEKDGICFNIQKKNEILLNSQDW